MLNVDHSHLLVKWMGALVFDDTTADVRLVVEGESLPAHRVVLDSSSEYFKALLEENMKQPLQHEIVLEGVPLKSFKLLMSYMYTEQLKLEELDGDTLHEILVMAHKYGYAELEIRIIAQLAGNLSLGNVCKIFSTAHDLKLHELGEACYRLMIQEPNATLKTEAFCDLSEAALCHVLSQDTFTAEEIEIFEAVLRWGAKRPPGRDLADVLKAVRLPLIDTKNLVSTVMSSGLVPVELILDAIKKREFPAADRRLRGSLRSDVNLATSDCAALRLVALSHGDHTIPRCCGGRKYVSEDMPLYDSMFEVPVDGELTIALREPSFINHIGFGIRIFSQCSYIVEVSVDLLDWARVTDHSEYHCGSSQNLYFERRVVRYIRLICTRSNSEDDIMRLRKLKVEHTTTPSEPSQGFRAVVGDVSWSSRYLILNGGRADLRNRIKHDLYFISHVIGDGSIVMKLPQAYTVDSMRMCLGDGSRWGYKYYVETSPDEKRWTRLADRTDEFCRSWQHIIFDARLVLYIKIVGTASTGDKFFSCTSFECPDTLRRVLPHLD